MKRNLPGLVFIFVLMALLLSPIVSCKQEKEEAPLAEGVPVLRNDLAEGSLVITSAIEGENFSLVREYSTPYDAQHWRITDSKNLAMKAWLAADAGVTVLVEHVHADVAIKSKYAAFDGWPQDYMDDSIHGGEQPGFWVTHNYRYENVFAIEGFSESLIHGWQIFVGGYGGGEIDQDRITENDLVKHGGVYGNKIQVVYDLLIKNPDEPYFHTRSLIDEFIVPVDNSILTS